MIKLKSNFEINKIRKAGEILRIARAEVLKMIEPGISPNKLDSRFKSVVKKHGAKLSFLNYQGFPKSICVSVNDALIHGIPNDIPLVDGDLLSIDLGVCFENYHADSAFTISVGKSSPENDLLIKVAIEAFQAGITQIKKGARIGDISAAIGKVIEHYKMFTTVDYAGHGVGEELHEEPYVYNFGKSGTGPLIKPGLVIAIEPMILQNSQEVILDEDGWTVRSMDGTKASHYEHTILVNENYEAEILT